MSRAIGFLPREGLRMFAFDPQTDPTNVLVELAWAHPDDKRQSLCGAPCPKQETGGYCLDCHSVAWSAKTEAERRSQ